jgi:hypothetical protein
MFVEIVAGPVQTACSMGLNIQTAVRLGEILFEVSLLCLKVRVRC